MNPIKRASPEMVRECKELMNQRMENKISSFELSEKMFELDKKYPTAGFAAEAIKIYNREATKLGLELMKPEPEKKQESSTSTIWCAVNGCSNAGTMSNSTYHAATDQARWVCKEHWR